MKEDDLARDSVLSRIAVLYFYQEWYKVRIIFSEKNVNCVRTLR